MLNKSPVSFHRVLEGQKRLIYLNSIREIIIELLSEYLLNLMSIKYLNYWERITKYKELNGQCKGGEKNSLYLLSPWLRLL